METGRPSVGQGAPFILTKNCRELEKFTWASWIFKVLATAIIFDRNSQV